ncbi:hypothetical protein [Acinetobacter haemolyticus]|uniref:hypothetical protein n=1 Tax=Acinetobacter haemolyticus TaxID=29430 RepID=UPI000F738414|nr:hypothetical protein [Acinetobacter haemolyticus]NAR71216.1 hypothetical protein [Acinetobacter haemolyticus]RSN77362.1 hypothetical protein EA769_05485 [Acinetobacter haemolyticus]
MLKKKSCISAMVLCTPLLLIACGNGNNEPEKKVEIKPAPKLTNDATAYANAAWQLINEIDSLVYDKKIDEIEEKVRKPLRQLSTDWRINVKMTDSVTEGKYALCRKALTSLDSWARDVLANANSATQKQADYERDKNQCKGAIDNPALGNTSPK